MFNENLLLRSEGWLLCLAIIPHRVCVWNHEEPFLLLSLFHFSHRLSLPTCLSLPPPPSVRLPLPGPISILLCFQVQCFEVQSISSFVY